VKVRGRGDKKPGSSALLTWRRCRSKARRVSRCRYSPSCCVYLRRVRRSNNHVRQFSTGSTFCQISCLDCFGCFVFPVNGRDARNGREYSTRSIVCQMLCDTTNIGPIVTTSPAIITVLTRSPPSRGSGGRNGLILFWLLSATFMGNSGQKDIS
jgi:hypothetical protein